MGTPTEIDMKEVEIARKKFLKWLEEEANKQRFMDFIAETIEKLNVLGSIVRK